MSFGLAASTPGVAAVSPSTSSSSSALQHPNYICSTTSIAQGIDHCVPNAGNDGISSVTWSPLSNFLVSSNWDSHVRCWEVREQNGQIFSEPKAQVNHDKQSPVLSTCWSSDGSTVFSGGVDNAVRMWQLGAAVPATGIPQQIGAHDAPVKCVGFVKPTNMIVSGGWDGKLKFWDARQQSPAKEFILPERVYAMDVRDQLLVVGTAGRHVLAYDVSGEPREHTHKESPLKFQTRCIACFPDATGFAIGSIEGRVGIHYLQKIAGKESFAFKCHRETTTVYSVNCISFHNQFGTFATCGSDGIVNFWDKDNKQRLKGFHAIQRTVSAANFNAAGNLFAYASSYDWSHGCDRVQPGNEIYIHNVLEDEIRQKSRRR